LDERYPLANVERSTEPVDPFFNSNTVEGIAEAEPSLAAR
jgi:hypothetical protein